MPMPVSLVVKKLSKRRGRCSSIDTRAAVLDAAAHLLGVQRAWFGREILRSAGASCVIAWTALMVEIDDDLLQLSAVPDDLRKLPCQIEGHDDPFLCSSWRRKLSDSSMTSSDRQQSSVRALAGSSCHECAPMIFGRPPRVGDDAFCAHPDLFEAPGSSRVSQAQARLAVHDDRGEAAG